MENDEIHATWQHYSDPAPSHWNFHLEPDAGPRILNHGHFNGKINEKIIGNISENFL